MNVTLHPITKRGVPPTDLLADVYSGVVCDGAKLLLMGRALLKLLLCHQVIYQPGTADTAVDVAAVGVE
jgi:hypothetical protein